MEGDDDFVIERSYQLAGYLRIASISMAVYDILESAPRTWKYTREQWNAPQITLSFVLFLLIQFISIAAISLSNFGFFYSSFTQRLCDHYFLVPPICKVLQSVISQVILGFRAFNLSKRSRPVGWLLLTILIASTTLEGLTTLQHRIPYVDPVHRNCRGISHVDALGAWSYYAVVIIYDLTTTLICMFYLLKYKPISDPSFAKVTRMMFYDGIGYFTALTAVNVLNLVLFRASMDIQTAASSLGYAAIWIMAKRLIIHLHEISLERRLRSFSSRSELDDESFSEMMVETPYGPKSPSASLELTIPDFDIDAMEAEMDWEDEAPRFSVEKIVQVERRVRPVYSEEELAEEGEFS